jgi:hypothetical protein
LVIWICHCVWHGRFEIADLNSSLLFSIIKPTNALYFLSTVEPRTSNTIRSRRRFDFQVVRLSS